MKDSISVLMPVRNGERFLRRMLESVMKAKNHYDELLIFDDGSDDNTPELLREFEGPRVKIFHGNQPLGPGPATNFLALRAQHDLLARVDADDIMLPNRFKSHRKKLVETDVDFLFSNMILFGNFFAVPQKPRSLSGQELYHSLLRGNPLNNPTMTCRKQSFLELGGYGDGKAEDKDLWLRAAMAGSKMALLPGYTVLYRVHAGQTTRNGVKEPHSIALLEDQLRLHLVSSKS